MQDYKAKSMRCRLLAAASMAIIAISLSGCETFKVAQSGISTTNDAATTDMSSMQNVTGATHDQPLILGDEVSSLSAANSKGGQLFLQHIALTTGVPMSLDQISALITQETNIPVQVASQVDGFLNGSQGGQGGQGVPMPPLPGQAANITAPNLPGVSSSQSHLNVDCDSSLHACLDQIAAKAGVFWKNDNGTVVFFLTETKTFDIDALPGQTNITASISNAGSNGSSGGGASGGVSNSTQQTASISSHDDVYKSVQDGINTILAETASAGGSGTSLNVPTSVATNPTTGQITVTATPPELKAIANYMGPLNTDLSKNVLIDLHIYSVTLNNANNYGLNLQLAFQQLASRYGLSFSGATPPTISSGGATASAYVLSAPTGGNGLTTPTQGVVQALATQGNVSLDTEGSVIAMNGQPTPLQVAQNKAYIASSSTTNTVNAGNATSLTPGSYTIGFTGTFLPLVRDGKILLQFNANLTQDLGLVTQTSNGTEIQLPQTATQSFLQRVAMKSGETLVLSGFEQTSDQTQNNGVGASWFWGAGGGRSASHAKQALVVVIHVEDAGL